MIATDIITITCNHAHNSAITFVLDTHAAKGNKLLSCYSPSKKNIDPTSFFSVRRTILRKEHVK